MAFTTFFEGICFIEGDHPGAIKVGQVKSDLSFKIGAQLKNLKDVKSDLATKAKNLGCNCVLNFKYGQKSRWLAIDDVAYYGEGTGAIISQEDFNLLMEKWNKKE